jgi:hypothetical protein
MFAQMDEMCDPYRSVEQYKHQYEQCKDHYEVPPHNDDE